jgi:glycosyltransferase involved in cell wall biosynthesis
MRNLAHRFPDQIIFHGYIEKQDDINAILRRAVVALAPYDELPGSFTEFADPQKLKYYAANGVPTILTNVAPAAREMERCGAAVLLAQSAGPEKWASVLNNWLNNSSEWYVAAKSSYEYALNFERNHVYSKTFKTLFSLLDSESTRK